MPIPQTLIAHEPYTLYPTHAGLTCAQVEAVKFKELVPAQAFPGRAVGALDALKNTLGVVRFILAEYGLMVILGGQFCVKSI